MLLTISCKKDNSSVNKNKVCVSVKDYLTNQPVQGASVTIYVEAADGSGTGLSGVSDINGNTYIDYIDYIYLREIVVLALGYERNCGPVILDPNISLTREIFLLRRTGFIKFHIINQPPTFAADKFDLSMHSNINGCSGEGYIHIPPSSIMDSTFILSAVSGSNYIYWELRRNNILIHDSTFNTTVTMGDTALVQIDY